MMSIILYDEYLNCVPQVGTLAAVELNDSVLFRSRQAMVIAARIEILKLRTVGTPAVVHAFQKVSLVANQPREMAIVTDERICSNGISVSCAKDGP